MLNAVDGTSTEILSDGGIYYDGKIVGVCENRISERSVATHVER